MIKAFTDGSSVDLGDHPEYFVVTDCPNSYDRGLVCKNERMIQRWQNENLNVKWFVRVTDDTYLHLKNLYLFLLDYDPDEIIVFGSKSCIHLDFLSYPAGGVGVVFSRGFIQNFNWEIWDFSLKNGFVDDVNWGNYFFLTQTKFIHHPGFMQLPVTEGSQLYKYWLSQDKEWPLPFRPISFHQEKGYLNTKNMVEMPILQQSLDSLPYKPSKTLAYIPECKCREKIHQKCTYDDNPSKKTCSSDSDLLICLGPGPWPSIQ